MTLLRTYILHDIIAHMISYGLTTFHAKQDSKQTHVFSCLEPSP